MFLLFRFILLSFLIASPRLAFSQGKEDKTLQLFRMAQIYRAIDNYKNYDTVEIDDAEEFLGHGTDNGASLKGFYKNDSLKKISEWVGLSNRVVEYNYYFDSGRLFFVSYGESKYGINVSTGSIDHAKLIYVSGGKYYFKNDILIDAIISDREKEKTKSADAKSMLAESKSYMKLLDKKRKEKKE